MDYVTRLKQASYGKKVSQWIWVVTCDLSTNGVMPHHQFLSEEPTSYVRLRHQASPLRASHAMHPTHYGQGKAIP